jgi:hypothetical protein
MVRRSFGLILLCLILVGCGSDPGQIGAEVQAESSGLVASYTSRMGNFLGPPEIVFTLVSGATPQQAQDLWCRVLIPIFDRESQNIEMDIDDASGASFNIGNC